MLVVDVDVAIDQAVESIDAGIVVSQAHRDESRVSERAFRVTYGSRCGDISLAQNLNYSAHWLTSGLFHCLHDGALQLRRPCLRSSSASFPSAPRPSEPLRLPRFFKPQLSQRGVPGPRLLFGPRVSSSFIGTYRDPGLGTARPRLDRGRKLIWMAFRALRHRALSVCVCVCLFFGLKRFRGGGGEGVWGGSGKA